MNKQEMVDRLLTDTLQRRSDEMTRGGLRARGAQRCPDFAKLSERLLRRELQLRGLIDFDEPDFLEDDEGEGVSGDELRALISGSARPSLDNHFFD